MADHGCGAYLFGTGLIAAFVVFASGVALVVVFTVAFDASCAVGGWCSTLDTWFRDCHNKYQFSCVCCGDVLRVWSWRGSYVWVVCFTSAFGYACTCSLVGVCGSVAVAHVCGALLGGCIAVVMCVRA